MVEHAELFNADEIPEDLDDGDDDAKQDEGEADGKKPAAPAPEPTKAP